MSEPVAKPTKLPYVLLGLMSVVSFVGPFVIFFTLRGGDRPEWPPDRPVEWWTFGLIVAAAVALMGACLTVRRWSGPKSTT